VSGDRKDRSIILTSSEKPDMLLGVGVGGSKVCTQSLRIELSPCFRDAFRSFGTSYYTIFLINLGLAL
jgi:hypothetical protein